MLNLIPIIIPIAKPNTQALTHINSFMMTLIITMLLICITVLTMLLLKTAYDEFRRGE